MTTYTYAAVSTWPKVIVVGDPRLGDLLASCGAEWIVQPVAPTISGMWDAIESGTLDSESHILVVTDGTAATADELEATLASFAPFADTFVIASPERGPAIVARAQAIAPTVPNGDATKPIWVLPVHDVNQALDMMRHVLANKVTWTATGTPLVTAPVVPVHRPQTPSAYVTPEPTEMVAPVRHHLDDMQAQNTGFGNSFTFDDSGNVPGLETPAPGPAAPSFTPTGAAPAPMPAYEQSQVYSDSIIAQAQSGIAKNPNAIPGQVTIACMSSKGGSGKCMRADTLIVDPVTGTRQTIEDLVLRSETSQVYAFDGRFVSTHRINDKIYSGEKNTYTVTLRSGRRISATANHPLLTTAGWTPLEQVSAGQTLATAARLPHPSAPVRLDEAELDLLALLMAEGGTTDRGTSFTNFDPSVIEIADAAAQALGMTMVEKYPGQPGQYRLTGGSPVATAVPVGLCQCGCGQTTKTAPNRREYRLLGYAPGQPLRFVRGHWNTETTLRHLRREHGLDFVAAKNKTMPSAVHSLPADQLARFIALFWMCDGYAVASGGGDLGVTLASRDLIEALQHLLLRFGIVSKIGERTVKANGKTYPAWRLTVYSRSYDAFLASIPLWGEKAAGAAALAARTATAANPNVGSPTFTDEVYQAILAHRTRPTMAREVCDALGWNVATHVSPAMVLTHKATKRTGHKHLNLTGLRHWCEKAGPDAETEFGWIYDSEVFWDEIESITPDGPQRVYDIEVPGPHNFVAGDVIVHNSTTALCLAGMIAKASAAAGDPKRVVLVDLDTRDGQVGSLIGQYMPTSINIRVMPKWDAATVKANLVHDKKLGIDALLAPVRPRNADDVGPDFYRHILGVLQTTHDIVVLDCSVNYLDPLLGTAFQMSDEILFVTTLATTSVQGMARSLTELFADPADGGLGIPREKVGIVANQVINNVGMGKDKLLRAALGAPLVGQIPADQDAVLIATNSNRMSDLLKHNKLGPAYFRLATNCLPALPMAPLTAEQAQAQQAPTQQAPQAEQPKKKGLFGR